ncbi:MAG: PEP/pyruvate-binding domain-containing protein [Bryobacteraceae bacterium]
MQDFLDWNQSYQAGPAVCGGKGYNLARLARYGFRVPRGGVLPAGAPLSEIRDGLERLGLMEARVAVRSSATAEDSARASFAGIHRSFLNVTGVAAVERAAQGCIDSLQTPEAIAYRRRMGFRDEDVRCAVAICEMVDARSAGVAFSCDPATGRRDLILIDAAEGLGDAVVSGRVNPARMMWRNQSGRLVRQAGSAACAWLPAAVEEELAHQVRRIQWALGEGQDPQDVEWAYDGERLWLLQARPVTRLPRAGWPETAAMPRYWSTANLKDCQPGVICELSWSMLTEIVGDALFASLIAVGYPLPPGMEVVRRFQGRGFFDLTMMQWGFYDAFGIMPTDVVKLIGGQQPEIPAPPHPLKGPLGRRRRLASLRLLRRLWNHPRRAQAAIERHLNYSRSLTKVDWTGYSPAELLDALAQIGKAQEAFVPIAGLANGSSGPWQLALDTLVKDAGLIGRLQAGTGAVASAEQGYRLYDIAQGKSTVEEFLREFGHRGVYETDARNPRWAEDPSWILEQVQAIRENPPARDPRQSAEEVRLEAERELKRRFGWRTPLLLWLVRKLRESMAAREGAKSALVGVLLPVRRIVLEIGRRLVEAGRLEAPEQVFQLAHIDLTCWLRGYWDGAGARELAGDRTLRRERWLAETCPDVITEEPDGRLEATAGRPLGRPASLSGAGVWSGIGVSPGAASGPARVVRNPRDAAHLQQGDILVAPSTDPGWTPLFLRASGIVMETGGYLSHGAIVAREYGIPAVANVAGILDAFHDGERITVDGAGGRVSRGERV